jgi:hypothetical protein
MDRAGGNEIFAAALIKKRRYWPKYIQSEVIRQQYEANDVGDADAWNGNLESFYF